MSISKYYILGVYLKIYLDVCCLNRPFDDHTQDKIRLESEAVVTILTNMENKKWQMIGSDIINYEISRISNPDRKKKVIIISKISTQHINLNDSVINRAKAIEKHNIKSMDALHLASAEQEKVDIFLTTDQDLITKCSLQSSKIKIKVQNPVNWLMEVL